MPHIIEFKAGLPYQYSWQPMVKNWLHGGLLHPRKGYSDWVNFPERASINIHQARIQKMAVDV